MPSPPSPLLAGIEAGGTKFVCAVATCPDQPLAEIRFPTTSPKETLQKAADFFRKAETTHGPIASLGIGSFGPINIDAWSEDYGQILTTPKADWAGFHFGKTLRETHSFHCPISIDTDVNAAVLGEFTFGAGQHLSSVAYITIGTGIGAGFIENGVILHGRMHTEVGHIAMPDLDTAYQKSTNHCRFHTSCFEGRAAGPAIESRWGKPAEALPKDHPAWDLEAAYLAAGCITLTSTWSPDRILLGGGVPQKEGLLDKVHHEFTTQAGGYWDLPPQEHYIQLPQLGQKSGIIGALELARKNIEANELR